MSDKFHVNLREARKSTGMTQKEVAEKVGVARSTYALYETGQIRFNSTVGKLHK